MAIVKTMRSTKKRVRSGSVAKPRKRTLTASKYIMSTGLMPRKQFPSPPKIRTVCRYFGNFQTVNGGIGGTAAAVVFSANGMYDPDITGTGHQPMGFDEYMNLYDHYTVVGSRARVDFINGGAQPYYAFLAVRDTSSTTADSRVIIENGYVDYGVINGSTLDRAMVTLKQNVDIGDFLGRRDPLSDSELKGTASSNPAEQVYYHIGVFAFNQEDASNCTFNVVIEYDVVFHERRPTLPS